MLQSTLRSKKREEERSISRLARNLRHYEDLSFNSSAANKVREVIRSDAPDLFSRSEEYFYVRAAIHLSRHRQRLAKTQFLSQDSHSLTVRGTGTDSVDDCSVNV